MHRFGTEGSLGSLGLLMIYLGEFRPPRWAWFISLAVGAALIIAGYVWLGVILIVLITLLSIPWIADRAGLK